MSLVLIRTFLAIVETGSLIKASKYLNITQSTVTARLKSLEDEIGQKLLHRQKSGVVLTSSGRKFLRYAEAMKNMWQQALLETSMPKGMVSVCNLGCDVDLWASLGRLLTNRIRQSHPTTALTVQQADAAHLQDWLNVGIVDAAITYRQATFPGVSSAPLNSEELVLYSTDPNGTINSDPNYIYFDAGTEFGSQHAQAYADAGVAKNSFGTAAWTLDYLLDNGGSAYLPRALAQQHIDQGCLFELKAAPIFWRKVYLITNDQALESWPWLPDLMLEISNAT